MRAVADLVDGRFGRADQPADLSVGDFRVMPQQPGDGVRFVLPLRHGRVAWPFAPRQRLGNVGFRHFKAGIRVRLAALQLFLGELAIRDRVDTLHADRNFLVRDGLDLEGMQVAEIGDLFKGKNRVLDEPDSRRFRHQRFVHMIPRRPRPAIARIATASSVFAIVGSNMRWRDSDRKSRFRGVIP
jgi:hypothetical protein